MSDLHNFDGSQFGQMRTPAQNQAQFGGMRPETAENARLREEVTNLRTALASAQARVEKLEGALWQAGDRLNEVGSAFIDYLRDSKEDPQELREARADLNEDLAAIDAALAQEPPR